MTPVPGFDYPFTFPHTTGAVTYPASCPGEVEQQLEATSHLLEAYVQVFLTLLYFTSSPRKSVEARDWLSAL